MTRFTERYRRLLRRLTQLQAQATLTRAKRAEMAQIEAELEREELALWERHGAAGWEWGWGR